MTPYARRTRRLPPPPHVVFDDLAAPARTGPRVWLDLGERNWPRVLESDRPHRLVWSSIWSDRPDDRIELGLEPDGSDTALTYTLWTPHEVPEDAEDRRRRVSVMLWADLRESYGQ